VLRTSDIYCSYSAIELYVTMETYRQTEVLIKEMQDDKVKWDGGVSGNWTDRHLPLVEGLSPVVCNREV
jgi:hypothetical protein